MSDPISLNEWANLLVALKQIAERYGLAALEEAIRHLKTSGWRP